MSTTYTYFNNFDTSYVIFRSIDVFLKDFYTSFWKADMTFVSVHLFLLFVVMIMLKLSLTLNFYNSYDVLTSDISSYFNLKIL